jgi:predicted kinase
MKESTVYLISGQMCSGKTTYSKVLEKKTNAVRFSPDEWMLKLYPFPIKNEEFDSYYYLCCDIAWETAKEFIKRNINVILDFGFWEKSDRLKYVRLVQEIGADYKLIYVDCNESTIRERLRKRNNNLPKGCYYITEVMFDFFAPGFEPPGDDEVFEVFDNN